MAASVKSDITLDLLDKIDIRVGTIISVEDIEKSDKMVKLKVDFGDFDRIILVGMKKERENPKEIEGKQALFVINLAPRKMFGELSEGMSAVQTVPISYPAIVSTTTRSPVLRSEKDVEK